MADVSLRHRPPSPRARTAPRAPGKWWQRPAVIAAGAIGALLLAVLLLQVAIKIYQGQSLERSLTMDTTPIDLAIAAETVAVPGNMIRSSKVRRGGPVERADLIMHWPEMSGYTEDLKDDFREGAIDAPVIYATIAARDTPVDSTDRLQSVYARFFTGKALEAPEGLAGRALSADSGYAGEVIFYAASDPRPFVARCFAESTPEMPATCIRDIHFGRSLALTYRFNRTMLGDWRALDASMRALAEGFLTTPNATP